jgi:hypothetical protein
MKTQFMTEGDIILARMGAEIIFADKLNDAIRGELATKEKENQEMKIKLAGIEEAQKAYETADETQENNNGEGSVS